MALALQQDFAVGRSTVRRPVAGDVRATVMPFSTYLPEHTGSITLRPPGPFVAGSYTELILTYTAGTLGLDDTRVVKNFWRTTSPMAQPQFHHPAAPHYTTVQGTKRAQIHSWFS